MILSHPEVAAYLTGHFECAWESVRPVPRAEIDFGNGHRLTRTLNGNIAFQFCTADGKVFDILPGLVTPEEFLRKARIAALLNARMAQAEDPESFVAGYHAKVKDLDGAPPEAVRKAAEEIREQAFGRNDMSKCRVERGLKEALMTAELVHAHAGASDSASPRLLEDTLYNQAHRYPKVHALLAEHPLVSSKDLTKAVYKDILHVDLDDPYLGLAPYVLGGEIGRDIPAVDPHGSKGE